MYAFWSETTIQANNSDSWAAGFILLVSAVSMFFPLWSLSLMLWYSNGYAESVNLIVLLIITIITAIFVLVLHVTTNVPFLGQMLAQRWNALSYASALGITALCWYSSSLMSSVYIIRELKGIDDPHWKPALSTVSLIFLSVSLWFPDPVKADKTQLGATPINYAIEDSSNIAQVVYIPDVFAIFSGLSNYIGGSVAEKLERTLWIMWIVHYLLVTVGGVICFIFMGLYFTEHYHSSEKFTSVDFAAYANIICAGLAVICLLLTRMIYPKFSADAHAYKRLSFLAEVVFTFCAINGVVMAVLSESNFYSF